MKTKILSESEFREHVSAARKRVAMTDEIDGFSDRRFATILAALECGIKNPESEAHYDAFVMLELRARAGQE